jgi:DnaJ-class molecular chaperone
VTCLQGQTPTENLVEREEKEVAVVEASKEEVIDMVVTEIDRDLMTMLTGAEIKVDLVDVIEVSVIADMVTGDMVVVEGEGATVIDTEIEMETDMETETETVGLEGE